MVEENKSSTPVGMMAPPAAPVTSTAATAIASRVKMTDHQLETASKEELITHWKQQDALIDSLLSSHEGRNHCGSVSSWMVALHGTVILLYCYHLTQWLRLDRESHLCLPIQTIMRSHIELYFSQNSLKTNRTQWLWVNVFVISDW